MMEILYALLDWLFYLISSIKKYIIISLCALVVVFIAFMLLKNRQRNNNSEISWYADKANLPRICVSLRVLEKQVSEALANNKSISEECAGLCGLSYIEGYVVDDSEGSKDVIIVGLRGKCRPSLRLDDLIVLMRGITTSTYPYCSLDPLPENILRFEKLYRKYSNNKNNHLEEHLDELRKAWGPQEVIIGGVPRNSRVAHVMIEADYHMKKVSQSHIMLPGVESYLDISAGNQTLDSVHSRFWFNIADGNPTYIEDTGIVWLDQCNVIVKPQMQQVTSTGDRIDVDVNDPTADAFAHQLSMQFPAVTQFVDVYADLENLYRLRALLLVMNLRNALASLESDFNTYLSDYKYLDEKKMRPSYPPLANFRKLQVAIQSGRSIRTSFVFGGVSMETAVAPENISYDYETLLVDIAQKTSSSRPEQQALWWYMN